MAYADVHRRSLEDPEGFWLQAAGAIDWTVAPSRAIDRSNPPFYRWFPDARLNTCHNALDRHVDAGNGARTALIWDSPVTASQGRWTYEQLRNEVAKFAGVLRDLGVGKGDRVVIYLPMVPQALISMLACARLGAVHSVVFGGFAPAELAKRIEHAQPKVVVCASCGIEPTRVVEYKPIVDGALEMTDHQPSSVVVLQREQALAEMSARDVDWDEAMATATPADCVEVAATDPLYILYTSGTTGLPKGVVRDNGGHAVALTWSMKGLYDIDPGDVFWTASDVGWVVGHSYIVYAPLLAGATTVLYEGKPVGTPDAGAFWRVIAEHGVKALFTAPTALRAVKKVDPDAALLNGHDLGRFATLFVAGERLDPDTYRWASEILGVPVVDHWWQTETGWAICGNPRGIEPLPIKAGSATLGMPGWDVQVVGSDDRPLPAGTEGPLCCKLPLPPGAFTSLWQDDDRFVSSYMSAHPGYYLTGDGGFIDEDGYVFVMGRTDDVINIAGHRLSTGSMEEVLATHPAVAECAVIGVNDALKGQLARGFVVLKAGATIDHNTLCAELVATMRDRIGAVAAFRDVFVVDNLPKTRSGKILRRTMRDIADGKDEPVPSTIEDPTVLDKLRPILTEAPASGG